MRDAASSFIITARRNAISYDGPLADHPFEICRTSPTCSDDRTGLAHQLLAKAAVSV